jgi:uncharacterized protein YjeT (DUF2065 family)
LEGLLVGTELLIVLAGGFEMVAPARFKAWRTSMMQGGPETMTRIGDMFDARVGSGKDGQSDTTIRLIGGLLIVIGSLTTLVVWLVATTVSG